MRKFNGSWGWFWFWLIMFFPVAIVYWHAKQEEVKSGHRYYKK